MIVLQENKKLNRYATFLVFVIALFTSILSYIALAEIEKRNRIGIQQVLQTFLLTAQEAQDILIKQQRNTALSIAASETVISLTSQLISIEASATDKASSTLVTPDHMIGSLKQRVELIMGEHEKSEFFILSPDASILATSSPLTQQDQAVITSQFNNQLNKAFSGQIAFMPAEHLDNINTSPDPTKISDLAMYWLVPIRENKKILAALVLKIDPKGHFTKITSFSHLGESGETVAFNSKGHLFTPHSDYHSQALAKIQCHGFIPRTPVSSIAVFGVDMCTSHSEAAASTIDAALWNETYQYGLLSKINTEEAMGSYYHTRETLTQVISLTTALSILILLIVHVNRKRSEQKILQANQELETRVKKRTLALEQAKAELSTINKELEVLAITDNLTGLFNKRYYDMQLLDEWQRCMRSNYPIAILIFDIDFFKQFNDYYGHQAGDECLKKIGQFLTDVDINRRPGDLIARYGGEEFVVLLTAPTFDYCRKVAQALCDGIRTLNIPHERSKLAHTPVVTASVGCAIAMDVKQTNPDQLLNQADKALYSAKHSGRNCIHIYEEEQEAMVTPINGKSS